MICMASPQKENGYTPIANEILEQLVKLPMNGTQFRTLMVIWRYTYGFSRKEHNLSLSFISDATGCDQRQIQREIKKMAGRKIIIQKIKNGSYRKISFNKNYDEWLFNKSIGKSTDGEITDGKSTKGSIGEITKESIGKTTYQDKQKTKHKTNTYTEEFEEFYKHYPRAEEKKRTFTNWKKCIKEYSVEQLMAACTNYKLAKEDTEKQYLKTSANFLGRDKIFEDYIDYEQEEVKRPMAGGISF